MGVIDDWYGPPVAQDLLPLKALEPLQPPWHVCDGTSILGDQSWGGQTHVLGQISQLMCDLGGNPLDGGFP